MTTEIDAILAANAAYAESFGEKGKLVAKPARKIAILTCMDARFDPAKAAGLREGDAHVIRNAGGRASEDAIRSLVISYKLLGTRDWLVIHHTECGLLTITDGEMRDLLAKSLETAVWDGNGWHDVGAGPGSSEGDYINWMMIKSEPECLIGDVQRIRNHPLVPGNIAIYGYVYDVKTGRLREVPEASAVGKAVEFVNGQAQK